MTIRRAIEADAGTIHALVIELGAAVGMTGKVASRVEDIRDQGFGADPAFEALIAERDGAAVGLCLFFESFSTWDGRRGVYVQDIYVSEAARGLGLGRSRGERTYQVRGPGPRRRLRGALAQGAAGDV